MMRSVLTTLVQALLYATVVDTTVKRMTRETSRCEAADR